MRRFRDMPLSRQIVLGTIFVFALGALAQILLIDLSVKARVLRQLESQQSTRADYRSEVARTEIERLRQDVLFLATTPAAQALAGHIVAEGNPERLGAEVWKVSLRGIFSAFLNGRPDYYQVRFIGVANDGRELMRVERLDGDVVVTPDSSLQSKADRDYFQAALSLGPVETHLSELNLNQESGEVVEPHIRTLRAVAPVHSPDDRLFGMVVVNMDVGPLLDRLAGDLPTGTEAYVLNDQGDYLVHPDASRTFGFDLGRRYRWQDDLSSLEETPDPDSTGNTRFEAFTLSGVPMRGVTQRIHFDTERPERALTLSYATPDALIAAYVNAARNAATIVVVLGASLFFLIFYVYLRRTFAPLNKLTAAAQSIGKGDYGTALPARSGGEIGTLVQTFEQMLVDIRGREGRIQSQLEKLNLIDRITRSVGERLDLPSICQVVTRSLEDNLPVDFACVLLLQADTDLLRVASESSRQSALNERLGDGADRTVPVDDNGLGRSVAGTLAYEPDIREMRYSFLEQLAGAGLSSLVLAPLRAESEVYGVIAAARTAAEGFNSVDCEFLRQLSEHVGLAARHAQLYDSLNESYEELRRTQQAVIQEERLRVLGQMASGIAHDINNALSPVSLYTESMLETESQITEEGREYLEIIRRAVEDVTETVARMREFYRPREQQLELAPVDVNELVQQVLDLSQARWRDMAHGRGVTIEVEKGLAVDLPPIMGAESEIRDGLTNLVFNAVDAMPDGGTLALRTRAGESHGAAFVSVEGADTGIGMDDDTRRRCLEPFFTTKGERGTGLGLSMVFGMAKRHSAEIEIESAPGQGSTVRLIFPAAIGDLQPGECDDESAAPSSALRVLVVDDDPMLLRSVGDSLRRDGHAVTASSGGEEGIALFDQSLDRGEPFDVVITDLGMPRVDGRQVAARVKKASPSTPVVMLTGWGRRMHAEGDLPDHVDYLLAKPPKLREIRDVMARFARDDSALHRA